MQRPRFINRLGRCTQSSGGLAVGIGIGVVLGVAFKNLALGIAVGSAIGVILDRANTHKNRRE